MLELDEQLREGTEGRVAQEDILSVARETAGVSPSSHGSKGSTRAATAQGRTPWPVMERRSHGYSWDQPGVRPQASSRRTCRVRAITPCEG